jgi:enterochelin esterase-like enzyme
MTTNLLVITLFLMLTWLTGCTQTADKQPADPVPEASRGEIVRLASFPSQFIPPRHVDVWLPDGYPDAAPYAVLYMHDGQMLYDPSITWNGQAWDVDDIGSEMMDSGEVRPFIVVGVWNAGALRHSEYFPQKAFELLRQEEQEDVSSILVELGRSTGRFQPASDNYLKFLAEELKPYIDRRFAVSAHRDDTVIMGSSMGGLISMYAITQYPEVFGAAACLSTHWPGTFNEENNPIPGAFLRYLEQTLPGLDAGNRIYFDYGDQTLDALYPPLQQQVDDLMRRLGFGEHNWKTYFDEGADHSEQAWRNRLSVPLRFLLGIQESK